MATKLRQSVDKTTNQTPETVNCLKILLRGLIGLFGDETTSDITLIVGSKRYSVHKNILAASSQYFHRMFYSGQWKESNQTEIRLQDTPDCEEVFDTFIQYFYTGIVKLCPETAPHLLTLADKYAVAIKQTCVNFMMKTINNGDLDKALEWIPICKRLKVVDVLERCYAIICFNLEKASTLPGWSTLSLDDVLVILKRSDIIIPSEYSIYVAVQTWMLSQAECQMGTIKDLLSHVKFKNMTAIEIRQVEQSELATDKASDILSQQVNQTFRYLALKAEHQEYHIDANVSRTYTKGKTLEKVVFDYNKSAFVTPRYRNGTSRYKWVLSCKEGRSDDTVFRVCVSRVTNHIHRGKVRINMAMLLQNSQDITIHNLMEKTFEDVKMTTSNNGTVVEFAEKVHTAPNACLISFDIVGLHSYDIDHVDDW